MKASPMLDSVVHMELAINGFPLLHLFLLLWMKEVKAFKMTPCW